MKPVNKYIAITQIEKPEDKTETGIYIANDKLDDEYHTGEIAFVSDQAEKEGFKPKEKVLYKHYRNVTYKGYEFILIDDIIAKL